MKKVIKNPLFTFILGILICGTTGVLASTLMASNISYTPKDSTWKVNNVEDAIDDLYKSGKGGKNIIIYLDNEKTNSFPKKSDGYSIEKIECTNDANATFDINNWNLSISNISSSETVCNLYFSSKTLYAIVSQNLSNEEKLSEIFSVSDNLVNILSIEDEELISKLLESQAFRTALYDNYQLTESIISNSPMILSAMKKSTRYQVVSRSGQNKNFYSDKAFVLGFSCAGGSSGNYYVGKFLSSGEFQWAPASYYSSSGLAYKVNKFASNVYVNGVWGVSNNWENTMYSAIFEI